MATNQEKAFDLVRNSGVLRHVTTLARLKHIQTITNESLAVAKP